MNLRRFAVYLGVGLSVSFAALAIYVLTAKRYRRKKKENSSDGSGTLNFPFLTDGQCIKFIMNSKVMFIMRGLPGSGKSEVACQMKQVYGDKALVCSADDFRLIDQGEYFWKAEEYEKTHMMCEEKAKQACQNGTPVVVIDNTNIKKTFLYRYVSIAHSTGYHIVLVEPKTSWKYSISDLAQKNHHNITEEILRHQLSEFEQIVAVYYGWFLSEDSSRTLKDGMFEVLSDCCAKIPLFKNGLVEDMGQVEHGSLNPVENFSETILPSLSCLEHLCTRLHITTFFHKRGQAQRTHEYVSAVQDALGSVSTLMIVAWTITPRTVTARVKLSSKQLALWHHFNSLDFEQGSGDDLNTTLLTETDSPINPVSYENLVIKPTVGDGDTAHVTLSFRSDVKSVQGRYDMRDIVRLELTTHSYEENKVTEGIARNYGDGQWAVYLNKPILIKALFTGFYGS